MKRLIVMRHAKSDWNRAKETDHERPLSERGLAEAPMVGKELKALGWAPELVLCSDARRTEQTWECIAPFFPDARLELDHSLYLGGLAELRSSLMQVPTSVGTVLTLGHNPGWEELVSSIVGSVVEMKTAYAALLEPVEGELPFSELVSPGRMRLVKLLKPKD